MRTECIDHGKKGSTNGGYQCCLHEGYKTCLHVKALMIKTGEKPEGRVAMHSCDNRRCINPEHLSWGTQQENLLDMARKGRRPSKIPYEDTQKVKDMVASGVKIRQIAEQYGCSYQLVHQIVNGKQRRNHT